MDHVALYHCIIRLFHNNVVGIISIVLNIVEKHNMPSHKWTIIYGAGLLLLSQLFVIISSAMMDDLTTSIFANSRTMSLEEIPISAIVPSRVVQQEAAFLACHQAVPWKGGGTLHSCQQRERTHASGTRTCSAF